MKRLMALAMTAIWLAAGVAMPVRAQATADQLNKLSLESLTAPSGGGGYRPTPHRSYGGYHRASGRGNASSRTAGRHYGRGGRARYATRHYGAGRAAVGHSARYSQHGYSRVYGDRGRRSLTATTARHSALHYSYGHYSYGHYSHRHQCDQHHSHRRHSTASRHARR